LNQFSYFDIMTSSGSGEKITFNTFLSCTPARDYVIQGMPYEDQINRAVEMIKEADYVLVGAGAGMSTAAGVQYGGKFFEDNFSEFQEVYGKEPYMTDMYSAGFYPFPDSEARWGYFSKMALLAGADLDVTPLHKTLLDSFKGKKVFVLTTNVDNQFEKAGLPTKQIFATQGSYCLIQCKKGCHPKTYNAVSLFRDMDKARKNCRIPTEMVPKCPVCGGEMAMNLRSDDSFVEDEAWHDAERAFGDFLSEAIDKKLVLVEVGAGFNTPTIIRFPFERLVRQHENVKLIRLNINDNVIVPQSFGLRAVGIQADMAKSITDIAKGIHDSTAPSKTDSESSL